MPADGSSADHSAVDSACFDRLLLDEATLDYLRLEGREASYRNEETIIRRGERGRPLFILLQGEVEVRLNSSDGRHLSLARMGPGSTFGELSILRHMPTTADVVAVTPVRVLEYPAEHLATALAECAPLRNKLLHRLAGNLQHTTMDTWKHFQRAETLVSLARGDASDMPFVAVSARMRGVSRSITELAASTEPVLISGAAGTGKLLSARRIHAASARRDAPLIVVNCEQIPPGALRTLLFGSLLEGGHAGELGDELGSMHVAHQGTLVLRHLNALSAEEQLLLARLLSENSSPGATATTDVRLLATVRSAEETPDGLMAKVAAHFPCRIHLPALAERPRDIVPLARELLRRHDHDEPLELAESAEHALVSLRYHHRNVAELNDVVDLAASCTDSRLIEAEHIFGGVGDESEPRGVDLRGSKLAEHLLRRSWLRALRGFSLAGFLGAVILCLTLPASTAAATANAVVWNLWEPVVFASFLLLGALWCTVCPLSAAGRLAQRGLHGDRPHPSWAVRHGAALSLLGFFVIVTTEQAFHMTRRPFATGLLLTALIAAAVLCSLVYRRELWCRSLCPLGRLASVLAPAAPTSVGASRSICASTCTTHECFKGTGSIPGCTVFHHPQQLAQAHQCKLCFDCVHSCPHDSARPLLRLPLSGLGRVPTEASPMVVFACGLFLLAPLLLAAQGGGWFATRTGLLTSGTLAILVAALACPHMLGLLSRNRDLSVATRVGFTLALLGWGPLMAYQLGNIVPLRQVSLAARTGSPLASVLPFETTLAVVLQAAVVLLTTCAALLVAAHIRRRALAAGTPLRPAAWSLLWVGFAAYGAAALGLVLS